MKNYIYLSIIGLLCFSCSSNDDGADSNKKNVAPTVPVLTKPIDNKLCVNNTVTFEWNESIDFNIIYQIQIAKDNQFTKIIKTAESYKNEQIIELEKNTTYYWRTKATDSKGLSSAYSTTYKFYTAGDAEINHLPFAPELIAPAINTILNTTTASLKWNATDVDGSYLLTYDVYFGTANPPTVKISENTAEKIIDVTLEPTKEYFWKVVAKDKKGGETVGQVWKFKTN